MYVELYESEYQYIINCIKELLPSYYEEIIKSLYIDYSHTKIHLSSKVIYSIDLNLANKDIEFIKEFRDKLKNHKSLQEFELYDKYIDFFTFIYFHNIPPKNLDVKIIKLYFCF